jgi:ABC-2 type transport system permease protein
MSLIAVAKKDFQDSARSRWLWALTVLFVLFAGGGAYVYVGTDLLGSGPTDSDGLINLLSGSAGLLVPIIALLAGHKAIVGERESGSLKLLLSLPHSRAEAVFGKLLGRTVVVSGSILIGFLVATVLGVSLADQFDAVDFLAFTGITILLALAYVSIALGLSAATSSASRAIGLAVGFWLVFEFLWGFLAAGLLWAFNDFSLDGIVDGGVEGQYFLFTRLSPSTAYGTAVATLSEGQSLIQQLNVIGLFPVAGPGDSPLPGGEPVPFYLEDWFALVILAVWVIVPVVFGYLRFESTDL